MLLCWEPRRLCMKTTLISLAAEPILTLGSLKGLMLPYWARPTGIVQLTHYRMLQNEQGMRYQIQPAYRSNERISWITAKSQTFSFHNSHSECVVAVFVLQPISLFRYITSESKNSVPFFPNVLNSYFTCRSEYSTLKIIYICLYWISLIFWCPHSLCNCIKPR